MPSKSKRSYNATLQRSSGSGRFDSGWTNTLNERLQDPDFLPELEEISDSDNDEVVGHFNLADSDEEIISVSESDGSGFDSYESDKGGLFC